MFQMIFLPRLLSLLFALLGVSVSSTIQNFLYFSINAFVAIWIFRDFWKETLSAFPKDLPKILLVGVCGFFLYRLLSLAMGLLIAAIDPSFVNANDQNIAQMSQENYLLMALGTVILAPIAEEVFHRGVMFGLLYRRSPVAGYIVSTVVFSLVHIHNYIGLLPPQTMLLCFLQYLPAGVCLAAAYHLSGSILTPILIHSAVNAIAILSVR